MKANIRATREAPAPLFGTILFLALGLAIPTIIVGLTPSSSTNLWLGTAVIALVSAARFSWTVGSGERHLFEMVISLFTYGFLGIAPMVQVRTNSTPETTPGFATEYASTTVLLILTGLLAVFLGSAIRGLRAKRRAASVPDTAITTALLRIPAVRVHLVTALGLVMTAYFLYRVGPGSIFTPRAAFDAARASAWSDSTTAALVSGLATMSLLVAAVAQILLWRERKARSERAPIVLLLLTVASLMVVINPISSARYVVGTVYLGLLAASAVYASLTRYRLISTTALAGLFILFPLASTFRNTLEAKVQIASPLKSLTGGDFDSFDQINNAVFYVAANGSTLGHQLLGVVFFWVPRSIWPDKAVDTGILLAEFRNYSFTNLSAPLWAEFYINGGWLLLVVGMTALGYAARSWDARLNILTVSAGSPGVIGCVIPFYFLILLRGSLLQAVASVAVVLLLGAFLKRRAWRPSEQVKTLPMQKPSKMF